LNYVLSYCCSHSDITGNRSNESPIHRPESAQPDLLSARVNSPPKNDLGQSKALLHEIILLLGYFTLLNSQNQEVMLWGKAPATPIQKLCALPIQYFTEQKYKDILFPTLVAVCYENKNNTQVMQQEMSTMPLVEFIKEQNENKEKTSGTLST
jgi:hypothetical protein